MTRTVLSLAIEPLLVYGHYDFIHTANVFAPQKSIVRNTFSNCFPSWLSLLPQVDSDWDACTATLESHSEEIRSVAFSPDSRRLATGSDDGTVKLWNATTGACLATLEVGTAITYIVFGSAGPTLYTNVGTFVLDKLPGLSKPNSDAGWKLHVAGSA
jgi:WD40 repeat protein